MGANLSAFGRMLADNRNRKKPALQLFCDVGSHPWTPPSELEIVCDSVRAGHHRSHRLRQIPNGGEPLTREGSFLEFSQPRGTTSIGGRPTARWAHTTHLIAPPSALRALLTP
jgi:hypothetical protein